MYRMAWTRGFLLFTILVLVIAEDEEWWKTALIYQIYPQSYKDTNGDGIGDLPGITEKLHYLKDLGVDAVWLSPIYPSPWADCGYDTTDFKSIEPRYGTMEDFDDIHATAKSLGLKLLLDLVPGYNSNASEWFQLSLNRTDPYTNYYVWSDGKCSEDGVCEPPNNWLSVFRGPAWTWSEERQQFYFHQFSSAQPDLNYRDPNVVEEMKGVMRFWLDKGIDGFRVDAVSWLIEDEELRDEPRTNPDDPNYDPDDYYTLDHIYTTNQNETYDMARQWRLVAEEYRNTSVRVLIMETSGTDEQKVLFYGTPDQPAANYPMNFDLIFSVNKDSNASDYLAGINSWVDKMGDYRWPNWVIGNHDQHRVGSRVGEELIDAMNMLCLLLPGGAITYMGEEIGMIDNDDIPWEKTIDVQGINAGPENYKNLSRDNERTPFQWDDSFGAGFSTTDDTWLPINKNYVTVNVKTESDAGLTGTSHLFVYRNLTRLRHTDVIKYGNFSIKAVEESNVLIFRRSYNDDDVLVGINIGDSDTEVNFNDIFNNVSAELYIFTSSITSGYVYGGYISTSNVSLGPKVGIVLSTIPPR